MSKEKKKLEKLAYKELTLLHWLGPLLGSRCSAQHLGCAGEQERHTWPIKTQTMKRAITTECGKSPGGAELLSLTVQEARVRANYT